jgi:molecular chaperone GrpE
VWEKFGMSEETKKIHEASNADSNIEERTAEHSASQDSEVKKLRQELDAKCEEVKVNYDRFVRQVAELENFKKRATREKDEAVRFANESLVRDLLPVIDNLERAVAHAQGGGNGKPLVEGVEMVLKGLLDVLAKHGVAQISAVGQPFDPEKHEAMAQVESENHAPNTVIEEHHKGYLLKDRLLRPALVTVAMLLKTREKKNGETKVENGPTDD